nr:hypothetical protein [Tanacetum cinerariifolium]
EDKKTTTGLNIEEDTFNKLDDLVDEGNVYAVIEGRSTDKIKVFNAEAGGVSATGETLSTVTLAVSTVSIQPVLLKFFENQEAKTELASPKQTALGKDFSNPLMADSLSKTIWLSMHHVIAMKHWLFQSKRLLVKKHQIRLWLSRVEDNKVFGYILQVIKTTKLKKHESLREET